VFELFAAQRYLRAKRKQGVLSLITVISVLGVAAGVAALIIALAINNGFRGTLQRSLLGATAHVSILEKQVDTGVANTPELLPKLRAIPGVTGAGVTLYGNVLLSGPRQPSGAVLKGIELQSPMQRADLARILKQGSIDALGEAGSIVLGTKLAQECGLQLNSQFQLVSPQGEATPFGVRPSYFRFRVVGLFESGFYDLDKTWAFASLGETQRVLSLPGVVNAIELKVDPLDAAPRIATQAEAVIGPKLAALPWTEQNKQLISALKLERLVTGVTISLIQLVAALNILITLTMMVSEKTRDIALLLAMGASPGQIRRIFLIEGALLGGAGVALGLIAGFAVCVLGERYRWIRLDEDVYALSYVPFEPWLPDALWVAALALGISLLATLYPANQASRVAPAEALRYE
jgi:lipoprotein-releasing system permease protein